MIIGSTHQEDITILNIYTPNIGAVKYIKQILTEQKGEIDSNTVIKGDFVTILSIIDRTFREKVSKKKVNLKQHYRPNGPSRRIHNIALHPKAAKYTSS